MKIKMYEKLELVIVRDDRYGFVITEGNKICIKNVKANITIKLMHHKRFVNTIEIKNFVDRIGEDRLSAITNGDINYNFTDNDLVVKEDVLFCGQCSHVEFNHNGCLYTLHDDMQGITLTNP